MPFRQLLAAVAGVSTSSTAIGLLVYAEETYYNDWSGVAPNYKLWLIPVFFVAGVVSCLLAAFAARAANGRFLRRSRHHYVVGLVAGFDGLGSALWRYLGNVDLFFFVFCTILAVATAIVLDRQERPQSA